MSFFARFRRLPAPDAPASRGRRIAARITTVLASLFVLFVLIAPYDLERFTPKEFLRIPVEALFGLVLVLVLPPRPRRIAALVGGIALGVLTVLKIMDAGFDAVLYRPFDLVLDWPLFGPAIDYVDVTIGRWAAIGAVALAVVLALGVLVVTTLSVMRLTRTVERRRPMATRALVVLAVAWITLAVPGMPIASNSAAAFAYDHAVAVQAGLRDHEAFQAETAIDAFRDTAGPELLTALRGKDVIFTFVESYGRDAVEDPELAPQVTAALAEGSEKLRAAGYASRSGFLSSPTAGGGSWMAQATLLSGVWIDNQQRYRNLVTSDRLTLGDAFQKADWRTVGVMPGITQAWPEGEFFGYDQIYKATDLGYQGPRFGYATMPDQYTMSAFQRDERAKTDRKPIMAAIPLLSSHAPWSAIPDQVDWDSVGDGSIYRSMDASNDKPESIFGRDPVQVRADYRKSVVYSVRNLVSYVEKYGDDNLVVVFLGDHQPAQLVTGEGASRDVPISIVARDPAVMERVSSWGWNDGIKPGSEAPVWKMSEFRDKFLTAFGSQPPKSTHPAG
ncbi:sulfatase [Lentzea tibetensis]|uniref:Sulfatase n=1 Tax=Lentzea tibetensis TaxID=2591470 RepID=A0A563EF54_9PSEU|nr:sulfatase [Lentzea tibetensis]